MNRKLFINEIFDDSLAKYVEFEKNAGSELSSDVNINIIKCLVFIYGDLDLINPSITKDCKALIENMTKYGCSKDEINNFFNYFNNYDLFNVSKKLIDMFNYKQKVLNLENKYKEDFIKLLKGIIKIEENDELIACFNSEFTKNDLSSCYDNKLVKLDEIEFLEIEPIHSNKKKREIFSFQLDAVSGFVSIISILVFIFIICMGVVVINIIVG